jgi:hypothetical protein
VEDELRIHERPDLDRPILISAFRGWNDGGQGASLAAGYLAIQVIEYAGKDYRWTTNAYGSLDWSMGGYAALHVIVLLLLSGTVWLLALRGLYLEAERLELGRQEVDADGLGHVVAGKERVDLVRRRDADQRNLRDGDGVCSLDGRVDLTILRFVVRFLSLGATSRFQQQFEVR